MLYWKQHRRERDENTGYEGNDREAAEYSDVGTYRCFISWIPVVRCERHRYFFHYTRGYTRRARSSFAGFLCIEVMYYALRRKNQIVITQWVIELLTVEQTVMTCKTGNAYKAVEDFCEWLKANTVHHKEIHNVYRYD